MRHLVVFFLWLAIAPVAADELPFLEGNRYLEEGDYPRAAAAYRRELERRPTNAFARYNLALVLEGEGRFGPALEEIKKALELDPPGAYALVAGWTPRPFRSLELQPVNLLRARALVLQGRLLTRLGKPREALEPLQEAALWSTGDEIAAFRELGEAAGQADMLGEAADFYHHYLERALVYTGVDSDLAVWGPGYLRARDSGQAPQFLRSLSYRVDPEGTLRSGPLRLGLSLPAEAYDLQIAPNGIARVWAQRATLPVPLGQLLLFPSPHSISTPVQPATGGSGRLVSRHRLLEAGQTQPVWERLLQLSPSLCQVVLESPFLSLADRRRQLLELPEDSSYRSVRLGNLYLQQWMSDQQPGTLELAAQQFDTALRQRPELDQNFYNLAAVRFLQGRPEEGMQLLGSPARSRSGASRFELQLLLSRGALLAALETARAYAAQFPHDPYPRFAAAEILTELERDEEAVPIVEELLRQNPDLVEAGYLRVRLLARAGRFRDQVSELERLLQLDPYPYRARRMLAGLLERLGQAERARRLYEAYLRSAEPRFIEPSEYRAVLEQLTHVKEL